MSSCYAPDRPFHNFRAPRSGDRRILCSSGESCDGFLSTEVAKKSVGYLDCILLRSRIGEKPFHFFFYPYTIVAPFLADSRQSWSGRNWNKCTFSADLPGYVDRIGDVWLLQPEQQMERQNPCIGNRRHWAVCSTPRALSPNALSPRTLSPRVLSSRALSPNGLRNILKNQALQR